MPVAEERGAGREPDWRRGDGGLFKILDCLRTLVGVPLIFPPVPGLLVLVDAAGVDAEVARGVVGVGVEAEVDEVGDVAGEQF